MNTQKIKDSEYIYFGEDSARIAKEAERLAYVRGDSELAAAYGLIVDLLEENLYLRMELDK